MLSKSSDSYIIKNVTPTEYSSRQHTENSSDYFLKEHFLQYLCTIFFFSIDIRMSVSLTTIPRRIGAVSTFLTPQKKPNQLSDVYLDFFKSKKISKLPVKIPRLPLQYREIPLQTSNPPKMYWIEWKQILLKKGLVKAANTISKSLCKYCDQMEKIDAVMRKNNFFDVMEPELYDGNKLNEFSKRMEIHMTEQFGKWPRVYDQLPVLAMSNQICE